MLKVILAGNKCFLASVLAWSICFFNWVLLVWELDLSLLLARQVIVDWGWDFGFGILSYRQLVDPSRWQYGAESLGIENTSCLTNHFFFQIFLNLTWGKWREMVLTKILNCINKICLAKYEQKNFNRPGHPQNLLRSNFRKCSLSCDYLCETVFELFKFELIL